MIRHENDGTNTEQGYNFTPQYNGHRHWMKISETDHAKIRTGPGVYGVVTDLEDGQSYYVYGARCGLNCYCDAMVVRVKGREHDER